MHKLNKVKVWGLLGVFLLSFVFSIAQPYTVQAADADTKSSAEVTRALGYFYTMRRCLASGLNEGMSDYTDDELNNFRFLSGYKLPLGTQFINKSTGAQGDWDGNVNCDGGGEYGSWRRDAITALGYSSPRDMLCNVMNPYQSIAADETSVSRSATEAAYRSCLNGQGKLSIAPLIKLSKFGDDRNNDDRSRAFNNSVGMEYFGWGSPLDRSGIDLNLYMLYRSSFQQFCQPVAYSGGDVGSDFEKVTIQEPDVETESAKSVDLLVKKNRLDKTSDVIAHNVLPGTNSTMSCRDMINKLNATAAGATTALMNLPAEQQQQAAGSIADVNRGGTGSDSPDVITCTVEGLGWIICPVVSFMAKVTDAAYGFVSSLLVIQPLLTTNPDKGIYGAWSAMRNIANIAFVIAFMIIIFSQVSSIGISNYGIKKMLPRLIAAAILVNVSYWICAIAVDLSNIAGGSVRGLFTTIGATIPSANEGNSLQIGAATGAGWTGVAGSILAGTIATGTVLYIGLSALLPALIVVLMAIVTVVLVLVLRQALIILLIAAAPLAFVAFLLPNTESLFDKWRKLFITLLLMFPIIAGIFGASALASTIIMEGAKTNETGYKIAIQIMGAAVAIIPLFITPVVMKTAGGLLNRFGGVINNPNKGPFDRMRKGAEGIRKRQEGRREIRALSGGRVFGGGRFKRRAERAAISKGIEGEVARAQAGYIADQAQNVDAFQNQLAGGRRFGPGRRADPEATQRALANAINVQAKLEADEVNAAKAILQTLNLNPAQRTALETGGSVTANGKTFQGGSLQKAALSNAVAEQRMGDIEEAAKSVSGDAAKHLSQEISANYAGTKAKGVHLVDDMNLRKLASGNSLSEAELDDASARSLTGMSAALMSTQKEGSLARAVRVQDTMASGGTYAGVANTAKAVADAKSAARALRTDIEKFNNLGATGKTQVIKIATR